MVTFIQRGWKKQRLFYVHNPRFEHTNYTQFPLNRIEIENHVIDYN